MKTSYVLLVIGMVMISMTAVFTRDFGVLVLLCEALWDMLSSPRFWTICGYTWGGILVLLGIFHCDSPE